MQQDLAQSAVNAALSGSWKEALALNLQILKENPKDVDSLNRLARAYAELGNIKKAKSFSLKVLKIEPENPIAEKCLAKWKDQKGGNGGGGGRSGSYDAFLEEPGKTKLVNLLHVGSDAVLAKLDSGDEVCLSPHAHRVNCVTVDGDYIGRLPDDLSLRLRNLIKEGNIYRVYVKSTQKNRVCVFIREVSRGSSASKTQSFPPEKIDYVAFTPPELVRKKEDLFASDD